MSMIKGFMNDKHIIRNRAKDFLNKFREYGVESKIFDFTPELQETLSHLKSKGYLDYTTQDVFGVQKIVHVKLTNKGSGALFQARKSRIMKCVWPIFKYLIFPISALVIGSLIVGLFKNQ